MSSELADTSVYHLRQCKSNSFFATHVEHAFSFRLSRSEDIPQQFSLYTAGGGGEEKTTHTFLKCFIVAGGAHIEIMCV